MISQLTDPESPICCWPFCRNPATYQLTVICVLDDRNDEICLCTDHLNAVRDPRTKEVKEYMATVLHIHHDRIS